VISVPASWQLMSYFLATGLLMGAIFVSLASYSRVETATGVIVPDKGIAAIVPTRSGVITRIPVKYGERVPDGAILAEISVADQLPEGGSAAEKIQTAISRQGASLSAQIRSLEQSAQAQLEQVSVDRAGTLAELGELQSQLALQKRLLDSSLLDLESAKSLATRGFISTRDLKQREDLVLSRKLQLSQMEQTLVAKKAALKGMERNAASIAAQSKAQVASLNAMQAQVDQQSAVAQDSQTYVLRAPFAGRVTAVMARVGSVASSQQPLMSIVPDGAVLRAELQVPTNAIAFVREGQDVHLAIDAFPYQRFGTLKGRVTAISESAINVQGKSGPVAVYPIIVKLERENVTAFGRAQPLVPDMTLSARIVTDKQSLFQWLFEPVFAVRKRTAE